jgi:hypothetical protein
LTGHKHDFKTHLILAGNVRFLMKVILEETSQELETAVIQERHKNKISVSSSTQNTTMHTTTRTAIIIIRNPDKHGSFLLTHTHTVRLQTVYQTQSNLKRELKRSSVYIAHGLTPVSLHYTTLYCAI